MISAPVTIIAIVLYLSSTTLIASGLRQDNWLRHTPKQFLMLPGFLAIAFHFYAVYPALITEEGINLSFFNALSIISAFVCLLTLGAMLIRAMDLLTLVTLPITAITLALALIFPLTHVLPPDSSNGLKAHVIVSIFAYSLLGLAALQSLLLAMQNHYLHNHHPGGLVRLLPPLQMMEKLLFELIVIGFICLSLALISGFIFLENLFAQHLVHKTVLSILAWILFAVLLIGRWQLGWRGRTAIRWTMGGFASLLLAYFGSKFVLELLLS